MSGIRLRHFDSPPAHTSMLGRSGPRSGANYWFNGGVSVQERGYRDSNSCFLELSAAMMANGQIGREISMVLETASRLLKQSPEWLFELSAAIKQIALQQIEAVDQSRKRKRRRVAELICAVVLAASTKHEQNMPGNVFLELAADFEVVSGLFATSNNDSYPGYLSWGIGWPYLQCSAGWERFFGSDAQAAARAIKHKGFEHLFGFLQIDDLNGSWNTTAAGSSTSIVGFPGRWEP